MRLFLRIFGSVGKEWLCVDVVALKRKCSLLVNGQKFSIF